MGTTYVPVIQNNAPELNVVTLNVDDVNVADDLTVVGDITVNGSTLSVRSSSGSAGFSTAVTNDTFDRWRVLSGGAMEFGSGAAARDVGVSRGAANRLDVTTASLRIATVGRGLQIAEGANARMGVATLVAGTVTVANTSVTATTRIVLTVQSLGTVTSPKAVAVTAKTNGTSFVITSADATDTSVVLWLLLEAA